MPKGKTQTKKETKPTTKEAKAAKEVAPKKTRSVVSATGRKSTTQLMRELLSDYLDGDELKNAVNVIDERMEDIAIALKTKKKGGTGRKHYSGYIIFSQEVRPEVQESFSGGDIMKEIGRRWKELSQEERDEYNNRAQQAKDAETEHDSTEQPVEEKKTTKAAPKSSKAKATTKATTKASTKEKAESKTGKATKGKKGKAKKDSAEEQAFLEFCKENRSSVEEEYQNLSAKEVTEELRAMWDDLDEEERSEYISVNARA